MEEVKAEYETIKTTELNKAAEQTTEFAKKFIAE
jgi:hypothetical protein